MWVSKFAFWQGLGEHPAVLLVTYHVFHPLAHLPLARQQ